MDAGACPAGRPEAACRTGAYGWPVELVETQIGPRRIGVPEADVFGMPVTLGHSRRSPSAREYPPICAAGWRVSDKVAGHSVKDVLRAQSRWGRRRLVLPVG